MADSTIHNLTDGVTAEDLDEIPVERSPYGTGTNRKVAVSAVRKAIVGVKIAVLGDSLAAQFPLFDTTWPTILAERLNTAGAKVEVKNFSTGGHTFFRANTYTTAYDGATPVEQVIAWKPDVVLVELGVNDAVDAQLGTFDGRTLVQIQADADDTYDALAAALPDAVLIQVECTLYDTANFTTSTVLNKGIRTDFMTPKSSGILSGLETSEMLDDAVSATNRSILDNYETLRAHIAGLAGVEAVTVDLFKTERLGGTIVDSSHPSRFGHGLIAGYVMKGLRDVAAFMALVPVIGTQPLGVVQEDPDELFDDCLVASGTSYVDNTPGVIGGEGVNSSWGPARNINTDNWFRAYKASCLVGPLSVRNGVGIDSLLTVLILNAQPNQSLEYSFDGAAFADSGDDTDARGCLRSIFPIGLLNLSIATHELRLKVGFTVYGPYNVVVNASLLGHTNVTAVGNVGTGEDNLQQNTLPAGFVLPAVQRCVHVVQHGHFANTAAAKTVRSYFGTQLIATLTLTTSLAGDFEIEYWIAHTGSDTQSYYGRAIVQTAAGTYATATFRGTAAQDDDAAIVVKLTGEGANNNDIVQDFQRTDYL